MDKLSDKNVLITGGSLGIGFEVARKCAEEGASLVIAARNQYDLQNALQEIRSISDKNHQLYSLDVSDYSQVSTFVDWYKKERGLLHGLVNCAGVYGPIGKIHTVNMKDFVDTLHINFLGTVFMCHAFIPLFEKSIRKKIISYSGGGAASSFPYYSAYATSKVAIVRFTENLANEIADDDFDVNCIAPGFVITRLHQETLKAGAENASKAFFEKTRQTIENGGVSPEKAANLTVFLLSSDSDGITGKFLSAPWDPWQNIEFQNQLRTDKDIATLRRIDNKLFIKKST